MKMINGEDFVVYDKGSDSFHRYTVVIFNQRGRPPGHRDDESSAELNQVLHLTSDGDVQLSYEGVIDVPMGDKIALAALPELIQTHIEDCLR